MPIRITNSEYPHKEEWVDDDGCRMVGVHLEHNGCRSFGCVLHNPTDHPFRQFPLIWDNTERVFKRRLEDGSLIIDHDEIEFRKRFQLTTGFEWNWQTI